MRSNMEPEALIGAETLAWMRLKDRFAHTLPGTGYVIMDSAERVIKRIDHPRVVGIPTLQYEPPNVQTENWSMFDKVVAERAMAELDRLHVTFAPHRVLHIRDLIDERVEASLCADAHAAMPVDDEADEEAPSLRP